MRDHAPKLLKSICTLPITGSHDYSPRWAKKKMNKETAVFLAIFMTIAVGIISLVFPKHERIKVFYVVGAFAGLILTAIFSFWLIKKVIPADTSWLGYILGFLSYSILLGFFGKKMAKLADKPRLTKSEQDSGSNG